MNKKFTIYTLNTIETENLLMTPLELKEYLDFKVKRMYFFSVIGKGTGEHCHYEEKELFVMIKGSCTAVIDSGKGKEEISFIAPQTALYVPNYVWHGFKDFSQDAVLLALSSTNYSPDRSDYLEDYEQYVKIRDEKLGLW
jgi:mannose-6-phosphate isomerase-like protein (cupin superfamily)